VFNHCHGLSNVCLISTFFINNNPQDKSLITAATEAILAHHAALRDISFKMDACSSKMISRSFDLTFNFSWTKYAAITLSILTPLSTEVKESLKYASF
jgi:hypothetical protein